MFTPSFPRGLPGIHLAQLESLKGHLPTKCHPECPGARPCAGQPRLTCPRRIRQPLDCSHQAPLEKFPNFFAALHAFASGRPNQSQKEETTPAHAPGRCVHRECLDHPFSRRGPHSPRAPCAAGSGNGSAVEAPKRCNLAEGVPGPLWDTGCTYEHLAFSRGAQRLRHQSSCAERRRVFLSSRGELALRGRRIRIELHRAREQPAPTTAAAAAAATDWA